MAELERRILAANFEALGSGDPAARVTASDWLRLRGHVVTDYDPLGDRESRTLARGSYARPELVQQGLISPRAGTRILTACHAGKILPIRAPRKREPS